MGEPTTKQGRKRDAQRAREIILDAAEAAFAEHGFDGARIDAIVKASGYNTSLLFQYFGDKASLYAAVLQRFDTEMSVLSERVLAPWFTDSTLSLQRQDIQNFIETLAGTTFDYLMEHPRFLRILTWEMAEGWNAYRQIASKFITADVDQFETLFAKARQAGWLRSDLPAVIQLTMVFQSCQSFFAFLPIYQLQLPGVDTSNAAILAHMREHLVTWLIGAMMVDAPATAADKG